MKNKLVDKLIILALVISFLFCIYQLVLSKKQVGTVPYLVKSGDNVWVIAIQKFPNVLTDKVLYDIKRLNGLSNNYTIRPGQVLELPVYK